MQLLPRAVYTDGTYLDLKKGVSYESIDRSRLASFCLLNEDKVVFQMAIQPEQRLIWRKRTILTPGQEERVWHLVGWQKTIKGENIQCIGYISEEDGYVLMAGEWQGDHILMGNVELLDFE
jgi:hypothetical protein